MDRRRPARRLWGIAVVLSVAALSSTAAVTFGGSSSDDGGVRGVASALDASSRLRDRLSVFDRPATDADTVSPSFQMSLDTLPGPQETRRAVDIRSEAWFLAIRGDHLCLIHAETRASGGSACTTAAAVLGDGHMVLVGSTERDQHVVIGIVLLDGCHLSRLDSTHLWQQDNVAVLTADPSPEGFTATLQCIDEPDRALSIPTQTR